MVVDQISKGMGDAAKMFSDGMFDGGASAADAMKEGAKMFGGK